MYSVAWDDFGDSLAPREGVISTNVIMGQEREKEEKLPVSSISHCFYLVNQML